MIENINSESSAVMTRRYLGDGVYAWFDGYYIWLSTTRESGPERIALEPAVFDALLIFRASLAERPVVSADETVSPERDALAKLVATLELVMVRVCTCINPSLRLLAEDSIAIGRAALAGRKGES